jgi:hypothetical protein
MNTPSLAAAGRRQPASDVERIVVEREPRMEAPTSVLSASQPSRYRRFGVRADR